MPVPTASSISDAVQSLSPNSEDVRVHPAKLKELLTQFLDAGNFSINKIFTAAEIAILFAGVDFVVPTINQVVCPVQQAVKLMLNGAPDSNLPDGLGTNLAYGNYNDTSTACFNSGIQLASASSGDQVFISSELSSGLGGISADLTKGIAVKLQDSNDSSFAVSGALVTAEISDGGSGYHVNDQITIGDAVLKVLTISGEGEILSFQILTPGVENYLTDGVTPVDATGGLGADAKFFVTELDWSVNPMTLEVRFTYNLF